MTRRCRRIPANDRGATTATASAPAKRPTFAAIGHSTNPLRSSASAASTRKPPSKEMAPNGTVWFDGSSVRPWAFQAAARNRITEVRDPLAARGGALRFDARNSDVAPLTPTANPRAQLITPDNIIRRDVPFWESYEVLVPLGFPLARTDNDTAATREHFLSLGSPIYGPPWNGTPSLSLHILKGSFVWMTNVHAPAGSKILWQERVRENRWIRFTWHVIPSSHGFAELYVNDKPVIVTYGGKTQEGVDLPVLDESNATGPWVSQLSVYYDLGQFAHITLFFKNFAVGATQRAVEAG